MNCPKARERMTRLTREAGLADEPALAGHLERCASCGRAWRDHFRLLSTLDQPAPLPEFPDIAPRVLAALDRSHDSRTFEWRWAAAAVFLLASLTLGYLLGALSAGSPSPPQTMTSTYQEALSASVAGPGEFAFAEGGARPVVSPTRSRP